MNKTNAAPQKKRSDIRFEKEAKALQKNMEKRKKQKEAREKLNAAKRLSSDN